MQTRRQVLEYLKQQGPSTIKQLTQGLGLSETAIRHQLRSLEHSGWLVQNIQREGKGRPATVYALTAESESLFTKRYPQLLDALLSQAETAGVIETLLEGVAETFSKELSDKIRSLEGPAMFNALLEYIDYGAMLGTLEPTENGWELRAYNCLFHAAGLRSEHVCNLPVKFIHKATGLQVERPFCQRDGQRACHFLINQP